MNITTINNRLEKINQLLKEEGLEAVPCYGFKNNEEKNGIAIYGKRLNTAPVISDQDEIWQKSDEEVAHYLINCYQKNALNIDAAAVISSDYILEHVFPMVCSRDNILRLQRRNILYTEMLDMAICFSVRLAMETTKQNIAFFRITEHLLHQTGLTQEKILEAALHNIEKDYQIRTIKEVLDQISEGLIPQETTPPFWILTNSSGVEGAAAIASPKILAQMEEILGQQYIILPSSIHEVICVPYQSDTNLPELQKMVSSINASQVQPEERLTDNVYIWNNSKLTAFI